MFIHSKDFEQVLRSSLLEREDAEEALNAFLHSKGCGKWAVNFIAVDEKDKDKLTLYVQTEDKRAEKILSEYPSIRIHLSPLFIHHLLQVWDSGVHASQWKGYPQKKRGEIIQSYISGRLGISAQTLTLPASFGNYGYEVKMQTSAYERIQYSFFKLEEKGLSSSPTGFTLLKTIQPLETQLTSLKQGTNKHVDSVFAYVKQFKREFEAFEKITDSQLALEKGIKFLKFHKIELNKFLEKIS